MAFDAKTKIALVRDWKKKRFSLTELADKYHVVPSTARLWIKQSKNGYFKDTPEKKEYLSTKELSHQVKLLWEEVNKLKQGKCIKT